MPDSTEIVPQEEITNSNALLETARRVKIIDAETCEAGSDLALSAKRLRLKIEKYHKPHIDAANKTHKGLVKSMKELTEPLRKAEDWIKGAIVVYNREVERIRLEAAEKAEREAEEAARKERDRLEAEALKAVEKGDEEALARAEAEKKEVSEQDHLPVPTPKGKMPQGVSTRANWQAEVYDLPALIIAMQEDKAPKNFIIADVKAINKYAKATEGTRKIPGIRFYDKGTVSLRT